MKLEGSLDAFGLPDIFQLLSYTKKTGGLHLRNGVVDGVVYFASGAVTGASSDRGRQTLARRLVGSGAVADGPLGDAVARAGSDAVGVGRALLDAGAVSPQTLQQAAVEQAVDAVFDLLEWAEGDFSFSVDEANPDDVGVELATERVVAEAAARREMADQASARIASADVVLAMPVAPPGQRDMTPDEWALVALADGRRTVGEIADLTGSGYVTVVQALAGLTDRGLLEPVGGDADHAAAVRRRLALLAPLERAGAATTPVDRPAAGREDPTPAPAAQAAPAAPAEPRPSAGAAPGSSVAGSLAPRSGSFVPATPAPVATAAPVAAVAAESQAPPPAQASGSAGEGTVVATIGGAHVPEDVVPPRPEPLQGRRQPEHPEDAPVAPGRTPFEPARPVADSGRAPTVSAGVGGVNGSAAMAADPEAAAVIERDPSVNRSLLLRLIAGVRGL